MEAYIHDVAKILTSKTEYRPANPDRPYSVPYYITIIEIVVFDRLNQCESKHTFNLISHEIPAKQEKEI